MKYHKKNIVFGCWPISGNYGGKNNTHAIKLIKRSIEEGILEFDTAPNYGRGNADKLLAKLPKKYKQKIIINSKIGNSINNFKSFNINDLKKNFQKSLERLKVNKINTLFLHNPRNIKNSSEIFEYLKRLKKNGLIKNFGLSLANDYKYSEKFINKFDTIQYDFNMLCQKKYLYKSKFKKTRYKRSIFGSGTITEKFLLKKKLNFKKSDHRSKWLNNERINLIKKHLFEIKKMTNINLDILSFTFVKFNLKKDKMIIGFKNLKNLLDFLKIYKLNMSSKDYYKIKKYYNKYLLLYDKRPLV